MTAIMANALYPKWKEQLLQNNLPAGTVTATVMDTVTDQFWPSAYTAPAWAKTSTKGVFDVTFTARQPTPFD